jgi:hypothetical protein
MSKKRIIITIVGGAFTGGLAAASSCFPGNIAVTAIFASATGLVGALVAYFGGE